MTTTQDRFPTSNFYLAAYLLAHDAEIAAVEREHGGKATFVFLASDVLRGHANDFFLGQNALVAAPRFVDAIKRLKALLYDGA